MDCPKRSAVARDLPEDSLVEILARVPARSLCRSKCVAKAWRDVIEDPFHAKKLPQTLQGFFSMSPDLNGQHIDYASLLARSAPPHMDPSLSFLEKLPEVKNLTFLNSCNGLLVFEHKDETLGYVVCNPTTKQWGVVPRYAPPLDTYLVFDPAVSPHFHLIQFERGWEVIEDGFVVDDDDARNDVEEVMRTSVNVYSSESCERIHNVSGWYEHGLEEWSPLDSWCAVLDGMLHIIICAIICDYYVEDQIVALDVQGVIQKIIPVPTTDKTYRYAEAHYVAQSQGCLHFINKAVDDQLSIWVLEDYDTQKWVLKHSVSFMELFGGMSRWQSRGSHNKDYSIVAMHPDGNVVFIVQDWNQKLISYDMDHKLVSLIWTIKKYTSTTHVVPYVPCFLESPALTNKL